MDRPGSREEMVRDVVLQWKRRVIEVCAPPPNLVRALNTDDFERTPPKTILRFCETYFGFLAGGICTEPMRACFRRFPGGKRARFIEFSTFFLEFMKKVRNPVRILRESWRKRLNWSTISLKLKAISGSGPAKRKFENRFPLLGPPAKTGLYGPDHGFQWGEYACLPRFLAFPPRIWEKWVRPPISFFSKPILNSGPAGKILGSERWAGVKHVLCRYSQKMDLIRATQEGM